MKKIIAIAAALAILVTLAIGVPASAAKTWHVDDDGVEYPDPDYYSIQDAINATSTSPGDTIIVHAGNYTETVYIHKNDITLIGEGNPMVTGNGYPIPLPLPPLPPFPMTEEGIIIPAYVHGVTVDGFQVQDWNGPGIIVHHLVGQLPASRSTGDPPYNNTIQNNTIMDCRYGIYLSRTEDNMILNNTIERTESSGITIGLMSSGNDVMNNTVLLAKNAGITILGSSENDVKQNNISFSKENGINILNSINNRISQNIITEPREFGIRLNMPLPWGEILPCVGNIVEKNEIISPENTGIYLDVNTQDNHILQNTVTNPDMFGIQLEGMPPFDKPIIGNVIEENAVSSGDIGILMNNAGEFAGSGNQVIDNIITETTQPGIQLWNSYNNLIDNNQLSDCSAGILCEESRFNEIMNNRVSNPTGWNGIILGHSDENTVAMNDVSGGHAGIDFYASDNCTIIGNKVRDTMWCGINIGPEDHTSYTFGNLIEDNDISVRGTGINLYNAQETTVTKNRVTGLENGISIGGEHEPGEPGPDDPIYLSRNNDVTENNISDSDMGISLNRVEDTNIFLNKIVRPDNGIHLSETKNITVEKNDISGGKYGVHVGWGNSINNHILNNSIKLAEYAGIFLQDNATYNLINDNSIKNCGGGIILRDGPQFNDIIENTISNSKYNGIEVNNTRRNYIYMNTVSGSGWFDLYDSGYWSVPPPSNKWIDNIYETKNFTNAALVQFGTEFIVGFFYSEILESGNLSVTVSLQNQSQLCGHDIIVGVNYDEDFSVPEVVGGFPNALVTDEWGNGVATVEVELAPPPPIANDIIWVGVWVDETPFDWPPDYENMPPPVRVPLN